MTTATPTVLVEVFGSLRPHSWTLDAANPQDLYSVFMARATSMGWSSASASVAPLLWGMNDAMVDPGPTDEQRIGWVQVALTHSSSLGSPVIALLTCVGDSLHRLGDVTFDSARL